MFNFFNKKAASYKAANAYDRAAIKGYGAGFEACDKVAKAAVAGMRYCAEQRMAHVEALAARHAAWEALQDDIRKEEQACYAVDKDGNCIEVTIE